MRRSSPLRRLTPLRSRTRLRQVGKKGRRDRDELREAKRAVIERSRGLCEATALDHDCMGAATQFHHVEMRSSGGDNSPTNLLHVCTLGHYAIHAHPESSRALGLLARSSA